jgi:pentatricopeptide repeat protein
MKRFSRVFVASANKSRIRRRPREDCYSISASLSPWMQQHLQREPCRQNHTIACHRSAYLVHYGTFQRSPLSGDHQRWPRSFPDRPSEYSHFFPRSFATDDSSSSSTSSNLVSVYRKNTERLLETPLGELDHKLWGDTHMSILWWLNSCLDENTSANSSSSRLVASESIGKAFQLLDRIYQEEQVLLENGDGDVPEFFDHELLNLVLNRWRLLVSSRCILPERRIHDSQGKPEAGKIIITDPKSILERLYQYQETSPNLQPNIQSYSMIIDTISSLVEMYDEDYEIAEKEDLMAKVDEIVGWLVDLASHDSDNRGIDESGGDGLYTTGGERDDLSQQQQLHHAPTPNVVLFSSAMDAWTKSGLNGAADRVEELLEHMITLREWYPDWDIAPNKFTYSTAIDAWAKEKRVDKVRELLQRMQKQATEENDPSLKPGLPAFNGYLVALAKSGRVEEAQDLLNQMEDLYDSGELEEPPSVISYSTVIDGFARSKLEGASVRAESFLRRMMDREDLSPNAVTYNSVINAHMQSFNIGAAEALLREMHDTFLQTGNMDIRPTIQSYSVVISGIARSRRKDAGERAERILEQIQKMARSGDLDKPPDVILYNAVLDCWAKSSSKPETASRAVAFLEKMRDDKIVPDVISYNTIIHCLAQSGRARDAELMLDQMKEAGVYPNSITYNTLLAAYTNRKGENDRSRGSHSIDTVGAEKLFEKMRNDPNIAPDVVTYNTMLNAYSREGDIEKAEALLKELFLEDSPVSPDSTSINTVINAWTKSGRHNAPQRAEAILEQMLRPDASWQEGGKPLGIRPTSITFNSVMSAWTKTRKPEAPERCQRLFGMMSNNEVALIHPDFVTFNIMIHAWSLSNQEDAPEQAETLLQEMQQKVKAGNARMRPNTKTYGSLINVWSRSRRPEAGQKAEEYLRKIIQISEGKRSSHRQNSRSFKEEQPRVYEFTSTIRAWYDSGDSIAPYKADEILNLLLEQVKKGNKQATPDAKLFGVVLRTLAASTIPNKNVYADRIVELMIEFKVEPNKMLMDALLRCYSDLKQELVPPSDSGECDLSESNANKCSTETEMQE